MRHARLFLGWAAATMFATAWIACPAAAPAADKAPVKPPVKAPEKAPEKAPDKAPDLIPVTRKNVDAKIAEIVAYLWKTQNAKGHWDAIADPPVPKDDKDFNTARGGLSALTLLALRAAGEDEQDPKFQKAMSWMNEQPWRATYFRGLRAALYSQMQDPRYRKLLFEDGDFLLNSFIPNVGMYTYYPWKGYSSGGDYSNTQYGILGVWSAADHGYEVPPKYWLAVEKGYLDSECAEGGWNYSHGAAPGKNSKSYGSMTVAALATLFVVWEKLYILNDKDCRGDVNPELLRAIARGLKWMGDNFSATENPNRAGSYLTYYLYGVERVGVASGLKYFGDHDWYKEVVSNVLNKKIPSNDAWTLLCISYGRAPVAFNKLWYGGGWNEHPRDYAMLCRYLSRVYEKHINWQIMPLAVKNPDDFHDAPILAFSGKGSFAMKPEEAARIKNYLQRGGLLFCESIGDSAAFGSSVRQLCLQMFPGLEMTRLDANHPIYKSHNHLVGGQPELMGLSDGVRTLVVYSPKTLSCDWQRLNVVQGKTKFDFGANLVQYASDRGQLWSKEESYWPADLGHKAAKTITVGRVIHGEAKAEHVWNPTGGSGWQRMGILSRNKGGPGIALVTTDLSKPVDVKEVPVLHLTGITALLLKDEAKANLKAYVKSGGLLLADAAGGKQPFVDSFTKLSNELFGENSLVPLSPTALPFLTGAVDETGKVWYRHRNNLPRSRRPLEILGAQVTQDDGSKAWNVLFVPYDMTYAMVGSPAYDPAGLDPASVEKFVMAVLNWRLETPAPAAAPAAAPATAPEAAPAPAPAQ